MNVLQRYLYRGGVSMGDIINDDWFLEEYQRTHPEVCCTVPRLMLVQARGGGRVQADVDTMLRLSRARRQCHEAQVSGASLALRSVKQIRNNAKVIIPRILQFLFRKRTHSQSPVYFCVAQGCRFKASGVVPFLHHVEASHMSQAV
jgi:hypothetical protein